MLTSNITDDSGIHTMSSKKDSAFYDSSSLPYTNNLERKANSDCFPYHNHYKLCTDMEQLKVRSCDIFPRQVESQNAVKDSDFYHYINALESRKPSCCEENSGLSHCSRNIQMPSDPGGGK